MNFRVIIYPGRRIEVVGMVEVNFLLGLHIVNHVVNIVNFYLAFYCDFVCKKW